MPTLVTNETELRNALKNNSVIIATQNIIVTYRISVEVSNVTLMALPGVSITSNQRNHDNSGIFIFKGSSNNIILRNLTLKGPGAYDCNGYDLLSLEGATNVWVDHCDFQDGMDGNFDIKSPTDNVTVTWCRFRYFIDPIPHGEGGDSDDHRFSNLIGSNSDNKPTDGTFNITYAYCWWDEGCKQRMTRCRNSELHFLNCYWNSSVADYYVGPEKASCYFEGCTFAGAANSASKIWNVFNNTTNYCKFVNCSGNLPSNSGSVSAPSYIYDQLSASAALSYVTNTTCGAGATLTVTNAAAVSSSCDSGTTPDPDPQTDIEPITTSTFWNISDDDFKNLGTITTNTIVRNLLIAAKTDTTVTIDGNNKDIDGYSFTHRLKLGGTGSANYRHLKFKVTGNCTLTIYMMSSSKGNTRTLNVAGESFSNVITTLSAGDGNAITKETYNFTGAATSLYLYSANSGINIYGIKVEYAETPTTIENIENKSVARKVLRNGQVLILRDGKTYNLLGSRID